MKPLYRGKNDSLDYVLEPIIILKIKHGIHDMCDINSQASFDTISDMLCRILQNGAIGHTITQLNCKNKMVFEIT